eukprot:SAG22_NODE_157_length_16986_cov_17.230177_13_plen_59_part_00
MRGAEYLALGKEVFITISANVEIATGPGLCETCWNNRDQIASSMLHSAKNTSVTGYNL